MEKDTKNCKIMVCPAAWTVFAEKRKEDQIWAKMGQEYYKLMIKHVVFEVSKS